jgi:hypothetical protein
MKKTILLILLISTTAQLFGQLHYAKKFGDKVLVFKIDSNNGPALITLKDGLKLDTVAYAPSGNAAGYNLYDTYVEDDLIICVCSMPLWGAIVGSYTKSNGKWIRQSEIYGIVTRDDMKYSHEIDIIDKTHLKVINNGKEHICKLDFTKKTFKIEKKN